MARSKSVTLFDLLGPFSIVQSAYLSQLRRRHQASGTAFSESLKHLPPTEDLIPASLSLR